MRKLWEPNEDYDPSKPQSWGNLPYTLLYSRDFTQDELEELIQDTKTEGWEVLMLSFTPIRELPESIGQLTNLEELYLNRTQIRELPESIGQLKNLKVLDLSRTPIRELPESIGQLTNLEELYLNRTQIRELPESIGQLTNLRVLDLSHCHLKRISYSIVQLGLPFLEYHDSDIGIFLYNAEIDEDDITLFSQPREVIEAYYRNKQNQTFTLPECKVIFLGDGDTGKSSLIDRMVNGTFVPGSLPTDGVKLTKWTVPVDGQDFTLRVMDFGGQEIMHSMHRCFLTAHTVYVVVCEDRNDTDIDAVASRWLETVRAFATGCPVILALNKADLNPNVSVNERSLRERNPDLKTVLKTSAAVEPGAKFGTDGLAEAIREQIPGAVHAYRMNPDMLALKEALENMPEDTISSDRYRDLCSAHNITDPDLQYKLLGYFRDLGVAYYYERESLDTRLESVRVLNPQWLTNGIYRLILRTAESGFLSHREIKKTLRASHAGDVRRDITYTPEQTEYILHVMRFFQISHEIEEGVEMIPMKLPKTPPKTYDDFQKENALHLRWQGTYLPNNLIHRLLIQKFPELDTACVWRTGGRFRQEGGGCEALAEMNDRTLDVYVSGGRDCRQYMETFRARIQRILSDLNLKTAEIICCKVDGQEGYLDYVDVVQQYYDGRVEVYVPGIRKYVNPAKVLQDTYYEWEKEAAQFRERSLHGGVNVNVRVENHPKPEDVSPAGDEKTENEDEPENRNEKRVKFWQAWAEALNNLSEAARNFLLVLIIAVLILAFFLFPNLRGRITDFLHDLFGAV